MEKVDRPIILVSFPRSATASTARFLKKFGVHAVHQARPTTTTNSDPIKFSFTSGVEDKYSKAKVKSLYQFEASWELSWHILSLQKLNPEIQFLIMLRNPINACNSLRHYRITNKLKRNIDDLALMWTSLHQVIFQQAIRMKDKPKWMLFEKYIKGYYTEKLFNLFNIPITKQNVEQANKFLSGKINTRGEYKLENSPYFALCEQIQDIITTSLEEL